MGKNEHRYRWLAVWLFHINSHTLIDSVLYIKCGSTQSSSPSLETDHKLFPLAGRNLDCIKTLVCRLGAGASTRMVEVTVAADWRGQAAALDCFVFFSLAGRSALVHILLPIFPTPYMAPYSWLMAYTLPIFPHLFHV